MNKVNAHYEKQIKCISVIFPHSAIKKKEENQKLTNKCILKSRSKPQIIRNEYAYLRMEGSGGQKP